MPSDCIRFFEKYDMKKNIIFYFSDQQRADTVDFELMPNLSALAEDGVTFDKNITVQPICGPARACLQTGVYATKNGCFRNAVALPPSARTLADYFGEAGYDTAYIGKWHLASDNIPGRGIHCEKTAVPDERAGHYRYRRMADVLEFTSHGYGGYVFDENGVKIEFDGYRADAINGFALEYLDNRDRDKPFFMFISQLEPHHQNDRGRFEGYIPTVENYKNAPVPEDLSFLDGDYREQLPDYLSAINRIDYNLGLLVEKLKEQGIFDDTVIVYTSDHGCHFKTRNLEYKRCCHDNTVRTPLVIRGGGFEGGIHYTGLSSLLDLPPTLLSLAGIDVPSYYDGCDLKKIKDGEIPERDCVYIQISESQCGRAVRTAKYTYSVKAPTATGYLMRESRVYVEDYLYDNEKDPYQKNNLIKDPGYADVRKQLRVLLKREAKKIGEMNFTILPAVITKKR